MPRTGAAFGAALFAAVAGSATAAYDTTVPEKLYDLRLAAGDKVNTEEQNYNTESFGGQHNCGVTGAAPTKPRSLGFCHKFNDNACCAPVLDDENTEMFNMLTGLGLSCRLRGDIRTDPIAKWYCLNCDPEQPRYVRPAAFDPVADGSPSDGRGATMLVCKDWALSGFGDDPVLAGPDGRFQQCGLLKSSPCLGINENGEDAALGDRDRYTCGDDLVIPSSYKQTDENGTVNVVASIEAFMNADSMGPPMLDEMYGFKLVPDEACTDDKLIPLYADVTATLEGATAQQPLCLRTQDQLIKTPYTFTKDGTSTVSTFRDYFCANGFGNELPEDGDPGSYAEENCAEVRAAGVDPGAAEDKCSDPEKRKSHPCCCGVWLEERCFAGAGGLVPLWLTAALAALAVVAAV